MLEVRKLYHNTDFFFKINTTDLFLKGALGKDITTKFRENAKTLGLCYVIFLALLTTLRETINYQVLI